MTTTVGSLDLNAFNNLYSDSNQYFWFEGDASATYGAGAHVTLVPDTSFINNPTEQNILMNTDGLSIRNGLLPMMTLDNDSLDFNVVDTTNGTYVNVASFGNTTTIGVTNGTQAYMLFNYRSMQGIDKEGNTYFYVSDLRDANGEYSAKNTFIGDGVTTSFALSISASDNLVVKIDGVEQTINVDYTYDSSTWEITFASPPTDGAIINVTYISRNPNLKAYTFGNRTPGSIIGGMSLAEGRSTTASGYASHVEGVFSVASGSESHAEGRATTASGTSAHAEGLGSVASGINAHAEGDVTTASGQGAHAEGLLSVAGGKGSHAQNLGTVASSLAQTTIGKYNIEDTSDTYAFVIGNGTEDARSDALTVDWDGNTIMQGGLTLGTALSIANGGTGATTAADARNNLGIGNINFKTKTITNYQFTANQVRSISVPYPTLEGYTPILISAYCTNKSAIRVFNAYISDGNIKFEAVSQSSSTISGASFTFYLLYIKNTFLVNE